MKLRYLVKYPYSPKVDTLNALNIIGVFCVFSAGYGILLQPNISAHLFMAFCILAYKKDTVYKTVSFCSGSVSFFRAVASQVS